MKKRWLVLFALLCSLLLHGCAQNPRAWDDPDMTPITPVGQIPEAFVPIIQENLFHDAVAFDGCLLKAESIPAEGETGEMLHRVWMLDLYGNELASYTCTTGRAQHVTTLTATRDGGFLFVLPLSEFVDQNGVSGDSSITARVIKCGALLKGFDAGTPTALIDYGDFYLIVSENVTGIYEHTPPTISSIWHYTETVYSAYDNGGTLLFRAAVDSSPDYDAISRSFQLPY